MSNINDRLKLNRLKREFLKYRVIESKLSLYACHSINLTSILMELDIYRHAEAQNSTITLVETLTALSISAIASTYGIASVKKINDYENKIDKLHKNYKKLLKK